MSNVKFFYGTTTPTTSNLPDGGIHFNTSNSKIITVRQGDTLNEFLGTDENVMQWYNSPESSPSAPTSSDDILPLLASGEFSGPLEDGASAVGQTQCVGGVGVSYKGHIHAAGFLSTDNGFYGKGSGLTDLNADNITSGTLPVARGGTGCGDLRTLSTNMGLGPVSLVNKSFGANNITVGEVTGGDITVGGSKVYHVTISATFNVGSLFENPRETFRWKIIDHNVNCISTSWEGSDTVDISYSYNTSATSPLFGFPTITLTRNFSASGNIAPSPPPLKKCSGLIRLQIGTYV